MKNLLLPTSSRIQNERIHYYEFLTHLHSVPSPSVFCGSLQLCGMTKWLSSLFRFSITQCSSLMLHWEPSNKQLFNCFVRSIGMFSSALELKLLSVGLGTLVCFLISWEEGMNMMNESQSVVYNCHKLILPPVWSEQRRKKSGMCWDQRLSFFCAPGNAHTHT